MAGLSCTTIEKQVKKSKRKLRESSTPASSETYRQAIRNIDAILAKDGVEIRPDNWQQLAVDWYAPHEPDRAELGRYIAAHYDRLGVAWARDIMRLHVFLQAQDYAQVVAHYEGALRSYPRCALVEMWVAAYLMRTRGDFWQARQMDLNAAAELPAFAKPHYELGFMNYLLGDFRGALDQFDQAAAKLAADDSALGSRVFYNRGLVRFAISGDRQAALVDIREALRRRPDYAQAKEALRTLEGKLRWLPW